MSVAQGRRRERGWREVCGGWWAAESAQDWREIGEEGGGWGGVGPSAGASGPAVCRRGEVVGGGLWEGGLVDGFDGFDARDVGFDVFLDALGERHFGGGAADAGAVESDFDGAVVGEVDEFDVAAVGLDGWTDSVDDAGDVAEACVEVVVGGVVWRWWARCWCCHAGLKCSRAVGVWRGVGR